MSKFNELNNGPAINGPNIEWRKPSSMHCQEKFGEENEASRAVKKSNCNIQLMECKVLFYFIYQSSKCFYRCALPDITWA